MAWHSVSVFVFLAEDLAPVNGSTARKICWQRCAEIRYTHTHTLIVPTTTTTLHSRAPPSNGRRPREEEKEKEKESPMIDLL